MVSYWTVNETTQVAPRSAISPTICVSRCRIGSISLSCVVEVVPLVTALLLPPLLFEGSAPSLYTFLIRSTSANLRNDASSKAHSLPWTFDDRCWLTLSRVTSGVVATLTTSRFLVVSLTPKRRNASPIYFCVWLVITKYQYYTGIDVYAHCCSGSVRRRSRNGCCGT